jgi:flavin-dependent dehydrogenase
MALARAGARVVLFERSEYNTMRYGEMLSPRARLPLCRLGIWEAFLAQGHAPSPATVSVWGEDTPHETHFICNPYGHGWHVDRRRLDEGLAVAAEEAGACVRRGARVVSCQPRGAASWSVDFTSARGGEQVQAAFVVDATGRPSTLARAQGVARVSHDRLVGIVCTFSDANRTPQPDRRTLVEAVAAGWWYSAQLPDARVVAAYMTDADLISRPKRRLATHYQRLLDAAPHTRTRLNDLTTDSDVVLMSANSSTLERVIGANWLAVGDAAMAVDPLSAQGIYRALESGIAAAEAIGADAGEKAHAIQRYERRVRHAFDGYLRKRRTYYLNETRWPQSVFWSRRHSSSYGEGGGGHGVGVIPGHNNAYT